MMDASLENKKGVKVNKKYFLIVIVSFLLMIFQFLLSKELLLLNGPYLFRIVIPLVLIGYGIGSALSGARLFKDHFHVKILVALSFAIICSAFILTRILILERFSSLGCYFFGLVWPFIVFGIYFGRVYSEAEDLRKVFLANGFGLMLGAVFSGKVFRFMDWAGGLLFICLLLLLSALFFERKFRRITLSALILTILLFFHFNLFNPANPISSDFLFFAPGGKSIWHKNTELVRTDLLKTKDNFIIFTDGFAPTNIYHYGGYFPSGTGNSNFPAIPYGLRKYNSVLVIGTGGGSDLANALGDDVPNITGLELNPATVSLMKGRFKEYSGGIYSHPAVKIINQEGRSYVQNTSDIYDLIVLQGTDTATLGSFGSFTSSANLSAYLYTKEAIKRYWQILSDKGVLFICRGGPKSKRNPHFLSISQIYNTIEESNVAEDLNKHVFMTETDLKGSDMVFYSILLSKSYLKEDEYERLRSVSQRILQFSQVQEEVARLWGEDSKFTNSGAMSDNKPSFYNFGDWRKDMYGLWNIIALMLFFIIVICLFRKDIGVRKVFLFVLLGIGYIAIEISVAERMLLFLRNPAYSMQVVLSSFLLFGGLGGYFGTSLKKERIRLYSLFLFLAVIIYAGIFNLLYRYQLPSSQTGRILLSFLISGPIGFFAAVPFAIALSKTKEKRIMYAIDAVATVIGTLLIFFIHKYFGFNMGFALAGSVYFMVFLLGYV
jgi:spermidine synthase